MTHGAQVNVSNWLMPVATLVLALSFAFGSSLRDVVESVVFHLAMNPFDVGDKVRAYGGDHAPLRTSGGGMRLATQPAWRWWRAHR